MRKIVGVALVTVLAATSVVAQEYRALKRDWIHDRGGWWTPDSHRGWLPVVEYRDLDRPFMRWTQDRLVKQYGAKRVFVVLAAERNVRFLTVGCRDHHYFISFGSGDHRRFVGFAASPTGVSCMAMGHRGQASNWAQTYYIGAPEVWAGYLARLATYRDSR